MSGDLDKISFIAKYQTVRQLTEEEIEPLTRVLQQLSYSAYNFSGAANYIRNIDISENHQVKELLDLVFDIRKVADKVEDVIEARTDAAMSAIKSGVYDIKNIVDVVEDNINPTE